MNTLTRLGRLFLFFVVLQAFSVRAQYSQVNVEDLHKGRYYNQTWVYVNGCKYKKLPHAILKHREFIYGLRIGFCSRWDTLNGQLTEIIIHSSFSKLPRWIHRLEHVKELKFLYFDEINWEKELPKLKKMKQLESLSIYIPSNKKITEKTINLLLELNQLKSLTVDYPFPSKEDPLLKRLLDRFGENLGYSYTH